MNRTVRSSSSCAWTTPVYRTAGPGATRAVMRGLGLALLVAAGAALGQAPAREPYARADLGAGRGSVAHANERHEARNDPRAALDELDLLDPAIDPQLATRLLSGLLDGEQPRGGPGAAGYELHRKWGPDGLRDDAFAGTAEGVHQARAAARLANGDVVVVGTIQGGGVSTDRNLGIVKYNSRGQRVAWPAAAAAYSHFNGGYLRFPGTDAWGGSTVFSVHDVRVRDADIYVLVTKVLPDNRFIPGVVRFRDNGSFGGSWESAPDGGIDRDAVAMDLLGTQLIVLGRRALGTTVPDSGFWTSRWTIAADGGLALGVTSTFLTAGRREPVDVVFQRTGLVPGTAKYYVAFTSNIGSTSSSDHDPCIARIDASNALDTTFFSGGVNCAPFDSGGNLIDLAVGLHNRSFTSLLPGGGVTTAEALYLLVNVERGVSNGTGIVNYTNGERDTNFGPLGKQLHGGCASSNPGVGEGCTATPALFRNVAHVPRSIYSSASPQGVYIVGHRTGGLAQAPATTRPMVMDVSATNGALRSIDVLGTVPNSVFTGLVPRGGTGEFTVVGWGSHDEGSAPKYFLSGHVVRRNDLIFYDGLQSP
jgi:hypothetical protein